MPKKTFKVEDLIKMVNKMNSEGMDSPEARTARNVLLEEVLFQTDNYKGFHYLNANAVPAGAEPGIIFDDSPEGLRDHVYPDPSRVNYYF